MYSKASPWTRGGGLIAKRVKQFILGRVLLIESFKFWLFNLVLLIPLPLAIALIIPVAAAIATEFGCSGLSFFFNFGI